MTGVPPAVLGDPNRIKALKESQLLDSPRDEWFDRITQLATKLVGTPVAFVSVVDVDRQFFKSDAGAEGSWAVKRETPLSHSFCQWVAGGHEELVVTDARKHPVLRTNAAIRDLNVIAYAGVPFSLPSATETLGSFCVVDSKPRDWSEAELAALRDLSSIVQSYVASNAKIEDRRATADSVANGIVGAVRLLLGSDAARDEIAALIEHQSHRLVQLTA